MSARRLRVDRYSRDYYPKAVRESERVAARLRAATGLDVGVHPVIVLTGVDRNNVEIRRQPADVAVVLRRELHGWLQALPAVLAAGEVSRLADAVRRPSTWDPSKVAAVLDRPPPPAAAPLPAPEPATAVAGTVPGPVKVVEWRRYGHHRRYVNDAETGEALGWRDERTGKVHVEDGADPSLVHEALDRGRG